MNIDNGHLVSLTKFFDLPDDEEDKAQDLAEKLKALKDSIQEREYTEVPKELESVAKKKLAGKDEAFVSLTSGGKLSKWAAKQRKAKRKAQRESRRKNR